MWPEMKELSMFIDESGDFRKYNKSKREIYVTDAMEERLKKIFDNADKLEEEVVYEYKLTSEMFL